jgi:hypothetical protein
MLVPLVCRLVMAEAALDVGGEGGLFADDISSIYCTIGLANILTSINAEPT